jgi:hypothetical protein
LKSLQITFALAAVLCIFTASAEAQSRVDNYFDIGTACDGSTGEWIDYYGNILSTPSAAQEDYCDS